MFAFLVEEFLEFKTPPPPNTGGSTFYKDLYGEFLPDKRTFLKLQVYGKVSNLRLRYVKWKVNFSFGNG